MAFPFNDRLIQFGGIRHPTEYKAFLKERQQQKDEQKQRNSQSQQPRLPDSDDKEASTNLRFTNHDLKEEIEFEMHSSEHGGEEEEEEPHIRYRRLEFQCITLFTISLFVE